jgi:hypothetical protein
MTEEDTLRILRRPSYHEMKNIWINSEEYKDKISNYPDLQIAIRRLFHSYGWTVEEYTNNSIRCNF